jgi:putative flippase GtrA
METFIIKFIKFCAVGFSGLFVDFFITWLLKEKVRTNKYLANATGFLTAATSNYVLNRVWTFRSTNDGILLEYTSFLAVSTAGLLINTVVMYFLIEKKQYNFYISKVFATIVVTCWNFFANYYFTF